MNDSKVQVGVKKLSIHLQSAQNRLLIKGGKVVNDDRMFNADVYIEDGVIRQIGTQLITPGGTRVIDAAGKLIIPGGIDTNTCFDYASKGTRSSDDFYSGSKAALAGGTTTISETSLVTAYEKIREVADSKVCCDYGLYAIVPHMNPKILQEMEVLVKDKGIVAFRVFMSNENNMSMNDTELFQIFKKSQELGAIAQVHAVNGKLIEILEAKVYNDGITGPEGFLYSHPEAAEVESTNRAVMLANSANCPVYILQVMSSKVASQMLESRLNGNVVIGETITAALGTDGSHYKDICWRHAAGFIVNPPLKLDPSVPEKLMQYVASGVLECTASNHCVFKAEQKALGKDDFRLIPHGVNGVEERLSIIWEKGVISGLLDPCKFVSVTSTNAAKVFNLYPKKGRIEVGSDADIVIWDGDAVSTISAKTHHQNVDFNIFEGQVCHGVPLFVIAAGKIVMEEGDLKVTQGAGNFISSAAFPPYIYERTKCYFASQLAKMVIREPYTGFVSKDVTSLVENGNHTNGVAKPVSTPEGDGVRSHAPTCGGNRNMQESSFSLSGAQHDDKLPIRTTIRTKQPPGGASNALW